MFKGLESGTWDISATNGSQRETGSKALTLDYSTTLTYFSATINVTYPAGSTCKAVCGDTTLTAPNTTGTWACVVQKPGVWIITISQDGKESKSKSVTIQSKQQVENVELSFTFYVFKGNVGVLNGYQFNAKVGENIKTSFGNNNAYIEYKGSSYMYGDGFIWFSPKINTTDFSTLVFDVESTIPNSHLQFGLSSNISSTWYQQNINIVRATHGSFSRKLISIDVSNINSSNYITANVTNCDMTNRYFRIYNVYLEPAA